jgi:uncharacterized protein
MSDKKLILETTSRCNLNCSYCYMPEDSLEFSFEVFKKSVERFVEHNRRYLLVTFHGGEALTIGLDRFKELMNLEKKLNTKGLILKNNVQTNGTLIDSVWINFFRENSFHVGISMDGPKEVHDKNRVYYDGRGSYFEVMKAIDLLKEGDIPFGTITVLTKESLGKEEGIYKTIKKINALSSKINFYSSAGKGARYQDELELTPQEKLRIMKKFYDIYKDDSTNPLKLSPFDRIIESFFTEKSSICEYNGACNINSILFVDSRGNIYPCGRFIGNESAKLGNVFLNSLDEIEKSSFYTNQSLRKKNLECRTNLPFFRFHNGGCIYEALTKNGDWDSLSPDYEFKEQLIEYIYKDISERINVT